jgi:hypothetical protein
MERLADDIPRIETFHTDDELSLHFRLIGEHEGRAYIVNVQLSTQDTRTGALLKPPEYGSAVAKVMTLLMAEVTDSACNRR